MTEWIVQWTNGRLTQPQAELALWAVLLAALIALAATSLARGRRLRKRLHNLERRMGAVGERTESALMDNRESFKSSLDELKGDLTRVMGDMVRLQKQQSGELDRRLNGQEISARAQSEHLSRLSERMEQSDRKLDALREQVNLPMRADPGGDYLAQGLRLVTEQLKAMSAQLETLEKAQSRAPRSEEPPLVVEPEAPETADMQQTRFDAPAYDETPQYESSSWD